LDIRGFGKTASTGYLQYMFFTRYYYGDEMKNDEIGETCRTLLGRPRRRWEYNIKVDLREVGWTGVGIIYLA
jgi:hypothetical protein